MVYQIRRLMMRDYSEWHALWTAYLDFYSTTVPEAVYTTTFGRYLDPHVTDQQAFVAEEEERLIGLSGPYHLSSPPLAD